MLGIPTYRPRFHTDGNEFVMENESILSNLIGKRITKYWLMWDVLQDEWLADGPVVLEIENNRYEFTAYQLAEFSMTVNSFSLSDKLDWYDSGDEMPLVWNENAKPEWNNILNQSVKGINVLSYDFLKENNEDDFSLLGIEFILEHQSKGLNFFSIFNGLDQNEIMNIRIDNSQVKRKQILKD